MLVKKHEQCMSCDVDDTLLMWSDEYFRPHEGAIEIVDPNNGERVYLKPHHRHISFLKSQKARGRYVRVHSAGGWAWAEAVVKALNLEEFVDEVCTKDLVYVDDLRADEWMDRVYFPYADTTAS